MIGQRENTSTRSTEEATLTRERSLELLQNMRVLAAQILSWDLDESIRKEILVGMETAEKIALKYQIDPDCFHPNFPKDHEAFLLFVGISFRFKNATTFSERKKLLQQIQELCEWAMHDKPSVENKDSKKRQLNTQLTYLFVVAYNPKLFESIFLRYTAKPPTSFEGVIFFFQRLLTPTQQPEFVEEVRHLLSKLPADKDSGLVEYYNDIDKNQLHRQFTYLCSFFPESVKSETVSEAFYHSVLSSNDRRKGYVIYNDKAPLNSTKFHERNHARYSGLKPSGSFGTGLNEGVTETRSQLELIGNSLPYAFEHYLWNQQKLSREGTLSKERSLLIDMLTFFLEYGFPFNLLYVIPIILDLLGKIDFVPSKAYRDEVEMITTIIEGRPELEDALHERYEKCNFSTTKNLATQILQIYGLEGYLDLYLMMPSSISSASLWETAENLQEVLRPRSL